MSWCSEHSLLSCPGSVQLLHFCSSSSSSCHLLPKTPVPREMRSSTVWNHPYVEGASSEIEVHHPWNTPVPQRHCSFKVAVTLVFLDEPCEALWGDVSLCIWGQIFSVFYTLFMDTIQCSWLLYKIQKLYTMLIHFLYKKFFYVTSVIVPCHVTWTFFIWLNVRTHLPNFSVDTNLRVHFCLSCSRYDVGSLF